MSPRARFVVLLMLAWSAQGALVPHIAFAGIQPDIVLVLICTYGILSGPVTGAAWGFVGGFLQDLLAPGSIGVGALVKTIVGFSSGQVERTMLGDNLLMPVLTIGSISLLSQALYLSLLFLVGETIQFTDWLRTIVVPTALYTALASLLLFPLFSRILDKERGATVFK